MKWKLYTYKEDPAQSFGDWLSELATAVRGDNITVLDGNKVLIHIPEEWDGNYDEYGKLL